MGRLGIPDPRRLRGTGAEGRGRKPPTQEASLIGLDTRFRCSDPKQAASPCRMPPEVSTLLFPHILPRPLGFNLRGRELTEGRRDRPGRQWRQRRAYSGGGRGRFRRGCSSRLLARDTPHASKQTAHDAAGGFRVRVRAIASEAAVIKVALAPLAAREGLA